MPTTVTFAAAGAFIANTVLPFLAKALLATAISSTGSRKPGGKK